MIGMRPYWFDEEYSAILLGSPPMRSPGVVRLEGHDRKKDWDVKQAKGQTGASSAKNGDPIGQFKATFMLAADSVGDDGRDDFDRWEDFQRLLESIVDGPRAQALPIYHPDLARNHFTEVSVASIGGMIHDGVGGAIVIVDFIEYKPPKPKPVVKAAAKPGASSAVPFAPPKPDPNAAAKAELAALLEEARRP